MHSHGSYQWKIVLQARSYLPSKPGTYVKGYAFDWDKIKSLIGADDDLDGRIDFVIQEVIAVLNNDHPLFIGSRLGDEERRSIIPINTDSAFDDNLERLKEKDIPVPRYLRNFAEKLLYGPDVFEFVGW